MKSLFSPSVKCSFQTCFVTKVFLKCLLLGYFTFFMLKFVPHRRGFLFVYKSEVKGQSLRSCWGLSASLKVD